ncbi:MAG TPA: hypothetical protein ENG45_00455 [Candidatus Aenigmarchaeota archaeon]|nr:hypothetical protein [Candidatus Aenigmarchaeota archaeon]
MRIGIEVNGKSLNRIFRILNDHARETVRVDNLLIELLAQNVSSSDYLFLVLSKLERKNYVKGKTGELTIVERIPTGIMKEVKNEIVKELSKHKRLFVTPLEVAKFYQCPRRLYLEKVVMSKQFKRERGKVWDGEVVHLATNMFISNIIKEPVEKLIVDIPKIVIEKYHEKTTLDEKPVGEFLRNLYQLIRNEGFKLLFTEKTLESLRNGLVGTPDIIARKSSGEYIPIDIKLGRFVKSRGVKKEHLLQNVGEAILVEDFFRTDVRVIYLIYFQTNTLVKIDLNESLKQEFLRYKRELERSVTRNVIPSKSKLPNAINRVCKGCHVRPACENIELLRSLKLFSQQKIK